MNKKVGLNLPFFMHKNIVVKLFLIIMGESISMSEYLDNLVNELKQEGIEVPKENTVANSTNTFEEEQIARIQSVIGQTYSDEQLAILRHHGSSCILACAGSGKTFTSTNLIAKRILTGEIKDVNKLIYTTFSSAGAEEMRERINNLLSRLNVNIKVQVRTLHSFFLQILRTFGNNSDIIKESNRLKYIKKACADAGYGLRDKSEDLTIIDNLLSYQINNLLSDKKVMESPVNTTESLTLEQYTAIRKSYAEQKAAAKVIDYDDMQSYLYLWLVKYPISKDERLADLGRQVINYCKAMWHDFYIDEAQDTSKIQFAIIRAITTEREDKNKLDRTLVFIGDDDQCIYQWRGGDPSIILSMGPTFNIPTFVLNTNYRCCNEVLDYASKSIKCNNSRYAKEMKAYNDGGTVKIAVTQKDDLCNLSIIAVNHIKDLLDKGAKVEEIAVLCRNNFHLALVSNMLLREGIYCEMSEGMKLTKSYMYSDMKDIISLCETTWNSNLTSRILWKMCTYMSIGNASAIANFQDSSGLTLSDTLGWIIKRYSNKYLEFSKKLVIGLQAEQSMDYFAKTLSSNTLADMEALYHLLNTDDYYDKLKGLILQYLGVAGAYMYKSKDKSRSIQGLAQYVLNLCKKEGFDGMKDFLRITEQLEHGDMVIPGGKITLSTIHSAKGREWDNVIMFACDNVSEPSFDGITKMIDDGVNISDICENIEEERRLFYVGNTRARNSLLVITESKPSVFILEALDIIKPTKSINHDIVNMAMAGDCWADNYMDAFNSIVTDPNNKFYYHTNKTETSDVKQ